MRKLGKEHVMDTTRVQAPQTISGPTASTPQECNRTPGCPESTPRKAAKAGQNRTSPLIPHSSSLIPHPCSLVLLSALALAAAAAAPLPPQPETRAEGYRIVVDRVHQARSLALPLVEGEPRRVTGSQQLYVELSVHPPGPGQAVNIHSLEPRVLAFSEDNRPVPFASHTADDADPRADNAWRTRLLAGVVELSVSRLERLQGELVVYPRARPVTLDFAIAAKLPAVLEDEGLRASLVSADRDAKRLALVVETEWPAGVQLSRLDPDAPDGAFGLSGEGAALTPQSASTSTFRRGDREGRRYSLTYSTERPLPAKLRVQAIVRSGVPKKVPFTLPPISLPDTLDLPQADLTEPPPSLLRAGHPLHAERGGTIRLPVTGALSAPRSLALGLSRLDAGVPGPVRWVEVPVVSGAASLTDLRPGRYHVVLAWTTGVGAGSRPAGDAVVIEVAAGKETALPPLAALPAASPLSPVPAGDPAEAPSVQAGPYRISVDRVNANSSVALSYVPAPGRGDQPLDVRQSAQFHLSVHAPSEAARSGLAVFQVDGLTVHDGRRAVDLPHYGGALPTGAPFAAPGIALRAYVHAPAIPPAAREVHTIEGQIVAWERAGRLDLDLPLGGKLPVVVEQEGVRATLRELEVDDGVAQLALRVEAAPGSMILSTETDGSYGVSLHDAQGKSAPAAGGAYLNPRPHEADYRLEFNSVREAPARLRVRLLHRRGPRRVYPFRLERVPLPARPEARPSAG